MKKQTKDSLQKIFERFPQLDRAYYNENAGKASVAFHPGWKNITRADFNKNQKQTDSEKSK